MRLAIDFDGTVADTNRAKTAWILKNLGTVIEPWHCDRTSCVPIIGLPAYEQMSSQVYEREATLTTPEVPEAIACLKSLANRYELHIVTARPARRMLYAREWFIQNQCLELIHTFHSSAGSSKAAICASIEAVALIDDDLRHLAEIEMPSLQRFHLQHGREAIEPSDKIIVTNSWRAIREHLAIR
jgi:phosphoglycolate phosphatase-like HAD superfamily hydrolase